MSVKERLGFSAKPAAPVEKVCPTLGSTLLYFTRYRSCRCWFSFLFINRCFQRPLVLRKQSTILLLWRQPRKPQRKPWRRSRWEDQKGSVIGTKDFFFSSINIIFIFSQEALRLQQDVRKKKQEILEKHIETQKVSSSPLCNFSRVVEMLWPSCPHAKLKNQLGTHSVIFSNNI